MHAKIYVHKCLFFFSHIFLLNPTSSSWQHHTNTDRNICYIHLAVIYDQKMNSSSVLMCFQAVSAVNFHIPFSHFFCNLCVAVFHLLEMNHSKNAHRIPLILFYSCLQIKCPLKAMAEECVWVASVWPKHSSAHMILVFRKVCET